ncbi:hypothetical protein ACWKW1_27975, partial [Brevibacillus parabrevis]
IKTVKALLASSIAQTRAPYYQDQKVVGVPLVDVGVEIVDKFVFAAPNSKTLSLKRQSVKKTGASMV